MSAECCDPDGPQEAPGTPERDHEHNASEEHEGTTPFWRDRSLLPPVVSGVLLALGYGLEWLGGPGITSTVTQALALAAGAWTFLPGAIRRLLRGRLGVGLLMTIAAVGAVVLGHVGEAAALAFLFSIAEALEDRAMDRARRGLRALLSLLPETARLWRPTGEVTVPAAEVRESDILIVRPGERVATDGVVLSGRSSVDASAVTGESIPVEVAPGDAIPAGAINGAGAIQVEATADGRDNSLTMIVRLVEQANARKGERARLADRIARPLVPSVLGVSALIVVFGFIVGDPGLWIERALVVLVAASPCALAIAVPVTVISAIGAASKFGVVIKSGEAFEQLGAIRRVAFDKTGTLTRNKPRVVAIECSTPELRGPVLEYVAALEAVSTHPLAAALRAEIPNPTKAVDVVNHPGEGLSGTVDGHAIRLGSRRWLAAGRLTEPAVAMEEQGMTTIVVEVDGAVAGVLGIRDEARPEARAAIRQLEAAGISTVMLTGDNIRTAAAIAAGLGIREVRAEQLPWDKTSAIEEFSAREPTAMIGDGINDAPALAAANVGIAMGAAGSAVALEAADIAFTGTDLRLIPQALIHARRGRRIMTGNIAFALGIIIVLFPLALSGVLGLAGVVLVHESAEVLVILNGVRASRGRRTLPAL